MWNLDYDTSEFIYETETDSQTWRTGSQLPRAGEGGREWESGVWGERRQTITYSTDENQGPAYSTGN